VSKRSSLLRCATQDEVLRWYSDKVLVCEGDLIGKSREQLGSLRFRRDRDWLRS
jgi:hypothetical protein